MSEWQVTYWRELPTMVAARDGDDTVKAMLAARFQEAVDEAAMRLGDTAADDYLAGWRRTAWTQTDETPRAAVDRLTAELDAAWPTDTITRFLDSLERPA